MTTFDALLAPLSNALKNIGNLIDVETGSEILFFEDFVRSLLFGFSIQVPTFRQLIVELETNSDAMVLGLIAFKRSTLKDGFVRFRAKYFEHLYQYALGQIESMPVGDKLLQNIGLLKVIDGSVFPLIKSMDWGAFRTKRKALKVHLELCINNLQVTNYIIQAGNSDERKALLDMIKAFETYICDRGYFSYVVVNAIHKLGAFFIFRLKKNYKMERIQGLEITGIIPSCFLKVSDELVKFTSNPLQTEEAIFRIVRFQILKTHFIICTNRRDLSTAEIMLCYAYRWQIELFFKFLKRSLGAIHLFSNTKNGAKVYLTLMLTFVLLQVSLKQKCHKIVNNSGETATGLVVNTPRLQTDYAIATDWVYEMGLKFKYLFKISANWLTYLKNSIAQIFDYQLVIAFATQ